MALARGWAWVYGRLMRLWPHRKQETPLPPVYVGSYDDKLLRIRPLHIDPEDDRMSREDKERQLAFEEARRSPLTKGVKVPTKRIDR